MRTLQEMLMSIQKLKEAAKTKSENQNQKLFKRSVFGWLDKDVDKALRVGLEKAYSKASVRGSIYSISKSVLLESFGLSGLSQRKRCELVNLLLNLSYKNKRVFNQANSLIVETTYTLKEVVNLIYEENTVHSNI